MPLQHLLLSYCTAQPPRFEALMKMKKPGGFGIMITTHQKGDSNSVGNKVLPISDHANAGQCSSAKDSHEEWSNRSSSSSSQVEKKEKSSKGDHKTKTISKMKELLKWAANAERGKYIGRKVLHFRNKSTSVKAIGDEDEVSNESPKISLRWDVESCSTTSSIYSALPFKHHNQRDSLNSTPLHLRDHCLPTSGNWITTDSEFVVLEL